MEIMRPKPPSPIAGHPGANPAYEAWAHRHRLTRAAVYRTRTRGGGGRLGRGSSRGRVARNGRRRARTGRDRRLARGHGRRRGLGMCCRGQKAQADRQQGGVVPNGHV